MTTRFPGEGIEALSTDTLLDAEELGMEDGLDGVPQAATNRAVESHRAAVPEEYLNQLTPSGVGPHRLYLKIGMPLICIRNLPDSGLANGTRCILKAADLGAGLLTVQIFVNCYNFSNGRIIFVFSLQISVFYQIFAIVKQLEYPRIASVGRLCLILILQLKFQRQYYLLFS